MSRQYGRRYELQIGSDSQSVVINNLQISFFVDKTITDEPNKSKIEIYNLNLENRNKLINKEFKKVVLFAGYDEPRLVFAGEINNAYTTRKDLDYITTLECGDGQTDYAKTKIYTTLKAGTKESDVVKNCLDKMKKTNKGAIDLPKEKTYQRAKILCGKPREFLKVIAKNNNANWHILDGNLNILPKDKVLSNTDGFVLSLDTGMIGSPEISDDGLKVSCLLNPKLNIGGLVRVKSILSEYDGDYKIIKLSHSGDFLGDTWKTDLTVQNGKFKKVEKWKTQI